MAFGNISTFYLPITGSAGSSLWGTDVRKVLSAADATSDSDTRFDHSTGGAVTRTADPYTTSSSDGTEANFGWAIAPTDMNSVTGALRSFAAGNHVASVVMSNAPSNTMVTGTLTMFVYRVGPAAGRTRTLLGNASASVVIPALAASVTASVTVTLAEVIFEADETVQYSFEFLCAGVAVTGRTVAFYTGTTGGVQSRIATPTLRVLAATTGTATGTGTASGVSANILATQGSAAGSGTASGVMSSRADTTGTAAGTSTVTGSGSSVAGTTGTATGSGTAAGVGGKVLGTVGTVEIGGTGGTTIIRKFWPTSE